jgi:hypothetical protein
VRWCGRLLDGVSANVREGQQVRQCVDGLRTNTVAVTATGSCSIWQFTGSEGLDEAYVPFFGAFGAAWHYAMVQTTDRPASAMRSGSQAGLVGSCAHIDIPTAITPTVTSAIQVRSLLFSANQSAIDEYAALLCLPLSTAMTRLLPLPKGPPSLAPAGPEGTCLVDESERTIHLAAPVPPSRTKRSLVI